MNPKIWGPPAWQFLYAVAKGYPKDPSSEEKVYYYTFYQNLGHVLPCSMCRDHYQQLWLEDPMTEEDLVDRDSLERWTTRLHQRVNRDRITKVNSTKPDSQDESSSSLVWAILGIVLLFI